MKTVAAAVAGTMAETRVWSGQEDLGGGEHLGQKRATLLH